MATIRKLMATECIKIQTEVMRICVGCKFGKSLTRQGPSAR